MIIKQVSTPDACKRQSPSHMYHNQVTKEASHRVHSNLGSANNSFLNPSMTSTSGIDAKWNQLNRLTQSNGIGHPKEKRNHALRNQKAVGGLTHDFGSSLSSHEKHHYKIKDHKLSCDASLYSRHHKGYKPQESPNLHNNKNSKYNDNEMLKDYISNHPQKDYISPALSQIEKNLTSYFNSSEYPYDEVKNYLENNTSIPQINTRESNESSLKKVSLYQIYWLLIVSWIHVACWRH